MANARANIFPIELRGAELNLNKFDAEIKQYSGFNKNNAPFVGGCLSNVFTKDTTVEGANNENSYVDTKGNVYNVNTTGLYKNGVKVIDTTGADFYGREPVEFLGNVFYVYDEFCYITINDPNDDATFILHYFSFRDNSWKDVTLLSVSRLAIYANSFSIKRHADNLRDWICVAIKTGNYRRRVYFKIIAEPMGNNLVLTYDSDNLVNYTPGTYDDINAVILKIAPSGSVYNSYLYDNEGCGYYFFSFTLTRDSTSIQILQEPTLEKDFSVSSSIFNEGRDFAKYYLVSEDQLFLKYFPASETGYNYNFRASVRYLAPAHVDNTDINQFGYFDFDCSTIRGSFSTNKKIKNYGMCYAGIIDSNNGYEAQKRAYAICDFVTMTATMEGNEVHFYTGAVVNQRILFNNEVVSGLCTPSGEVLLTEWNSVDENHIYLKSKDNQTTYKNDFEIIYKDTQGKFWKIVKTTPKLKVINNQIIINADVKYNAYNIEINDVMKFAIAYNNRLKMPYYSGVYGFPTDNQNHYYAAASINEYNQDKNSSIILNPLPVFCVAFMQSQAEGRISDYNDYKYLENIYWGETASDVVYHISLINNHITQCLVLDTLKGLPFPSNTDGNIPYTPSLFAEEKGNYGNFIVISEDGTAYKLMTYDNKAIMSYFLTTAVEGLQDFFTIQGQLYGILDDGIYSFSFINEVVNKGDFIVDVTGLQFCGNTPYEALFYSKTNRCLYSFSGANVLNAKQFVDKISEVYDYKYNPATQSIFLITDIGVIVYSLFGIYTFDKENIRGIYLLKNGVVFTDNLGHFYTLKYYPEEGLDKQNIQLETCFYGMNNQTVTINDCLYIRLFSEEHEEGDLVISASTLTNTGRRTEETTFKLRAEDWDKMTHSIYIRYQPKQQRGLGISFKINSPFKIASLSVGTQADTILIDKASKGAINAPYNNTSSVIDW